MRYPQSLRQMAMRLMWLGCPAVVIAMEYDIPRRVVLIWWASARRRRSQRRPPNRRK